jgi:hypothetical protein
MLVTESSTGETRFAVVMMMYVLDWDYREREYIIYHLGHRLENHLEATAYLELEKGMVGRSEKSIGSG